PRPQREHLVVGVHAAHRLPAETAIARQDQPLRLDTPERESDQLGDLLRALDLQRAVADDSKRDLLVLGDHPADVLEIEAAVECALEGDDVHVELIEVWQRVLAGLAAARLEARRRGGPPR